MMVDDNIQKMVGYDEMILRELASWHLFTRKTTVFDGPALELLYIAKHEVLSNI